MQLYPHQEQALIQTEDFNRVAYYLDMGLGKTFVGSEKMKQLGTDLNILVCQKSLISTWVEHFKTYYSDYDIYDLTSKNGMKAFMSCSSMIQNGQFKMIGVINYDLLFRRKFFLELEHYTLMLDESSMIQNEDAKRSKFVLQMKPDNVILLSGTPTSGKYENLWSQINLLGWNISKNLYNRQYVNWTTIEVGGFPMKIVDKDEPYKNVDRLKQKLRNHGAVFLKTDECFELPEQTFISINVPTSKEYRKFQKNSIITIDTLNMVEFKDDSDFEGTDATPRVELIGDTTLTKRLYSRMLCGQYNKDKLKAFEDLAYSTQDRLIVFYNFNEELTALKKIVDKLNRPISEVNGQVKDLSNYESEDNSITFIQYQAGAMGLNLQKSNKIIYFTLTEKSELFEQSKKRIHRIGQKNNCFYYLLICKGSLEEDILQTLEMRKDYTDELFKEYIRK
ncbi:DEAD/DEAH box helicase [Tepidibacter hydrothermalis]|uniref:DEAD/DEAH box helicase n=1 Tax=Tepidibacter hydrothermalis TaxID=3036126 RepID=A0ABY8EH47_9FIRM|nr:DEAD/DEAH box helicase [Tepidibacter hydrothermalis]WFD12243.1 DEAD/DEAH box helicase [Tepidibacter hydrothermalis]